MKNKTINPVNTKSTTPVHDHEVLDLNHRYPPLVGIPPIPVDIKEVYLFRNKISKLIFQNDLKKLVNLHKLDLSDNKIKELIDFSDIPNLHTLDLSFNLLDAIPEKISDSAEEIYLHCNDITDATELCNICDESINNKIEDNKIEDKKIEYFEYKIVSEKLKKLDLASNSLHKFPILETPNLEELYISSNHLTELPLFLKDLKKLKVLGIERNHFKNLDCSLLPESIVSLLIADNLKLKNVENINLLKKLKYLDIENTGIENLNVGIEVEVLRNNLK